MADLPPFIPPPRVTPVPHDSPLRWLVPSATKPGESHLVELDTYAGNGRCSCPDFSCRMEPQVRADLRRGTPGAWTEKTRCKHIRLVRGFFLDRVISEMAKSLRSAGAAALVILAGICKAAPSEAFLDSLAWAESRNNPAALGDFDWRGQPQARGAYQMQLAAWIDSQSRADLGPWEVYAHCPEASRRAARAYLTIAQDRLRKAGLEATTARLWLVWTMGWRDAARIGFDPSRASRTKRRGLDRLESALAGRPPTN